MSPLPPAVDPPSCAALLKALADETRLAVVRALLAGSRHVSELGEELGIEQSLLSHHLKALRLAGIVRAEREGRAVRYSVTPEVARSRRGQDRLDLGCCELRFHGLRSK